MSLERSCYIGDMRFWENVVALGFITGEDFLWVVGLRDSLKEMIGQSIMNNRKDRWNRELESSSNFMWSLSTRLFALNYCQESLWMRLYGGGSKEIWGNMAPNKIKTFGRQLLQYKIQTRGDLVRRGIISWRDVANYVWFLSATEAEDHIFCIVAYVRYVIFKWLGTGAILSKNIFSLLDFYHRRCSNNEKV